eukprot:TRINITY_DN6602_c0_g1_i1.p1 TRINITY_DN6602_c0_g1~~TRINITY_DN6602_c0_g1_i1.p1  ORF type:complete len:182 (-),score=14.35 TRINITY_DN6602_c0_g1_i1:265-810(-)
MCGSSFPLPLSLSLSLSLSPRSPLNRFNELKEGDLFDVETGTGELGGLSWSGNGCNSVASCCVVCCSFGWFSTLISGGIADISGAGGKAKVFGVVYVIAGSSRIKSFSSVVVDSKLSMVSTLNFKSISSPLNMAAVSLELFMSATSKGSLPRKSMHRVCFKPSNPLRTNTAADRARLKCAA